MKERAGQEEGRARARWQRRRDRRRDRRPRLGGQALPRRRLHLRRPGVHQRPAHVRPRGRLGRVHGPLRRPASRALKLGDPLDPDDGFGPDGRRHRGRRGPSAGSTRPSRSAARCSLGGTADGTSSRRRPDRRPADGPGLLNEAFAPLVVAFPFHDFDEAIAQVNDSSSGSRPVSSRTTWPTHGGRSTSSRSAA